MTKNKNITYLKNYWDSALSWYKNRDKEKNEVVFIEGDGFNRIREFLVRRNSGSLLLSGQRGSGKTSTIIKLTTDLKGKIFPIYLNALHLESIKNGDRSFLGMTEIIKQLVKAFILELERKNEPIPHSLQELLGDINTTELMWLKKHTSSRSVSADGVIGAGTGIYSLGNIKGELKSSYGKKIEDAKVAKKIGLTVEDIIERFSETIKITEIGQSKTLLKKRIKDFEFSLSKNEPNSGGELRKIVFIIDELDFYDEEGKQGEVGPEDVLEALKKFKNLFTLSEAQFVFIVGKNAYKISLEKDKYKTLFSERVFLAKPNGHQLSTYLDRILKFDLSKTDFELWDKQKWLIIAKSKHNFYSLVQLIKSQPYYHFDGQRSYIDLHELIAQDSPLIVIHFALNEIYRYNLFDPIHRHWDEILFEELYKIEDNFGDWVHENNQNPVTLKMGDTLSQIPTEIKGKINDAKKYLVKYLFLLSDREAPADLDTIENIVIPWAELIQNFKFDKVKSGVSGAISDEEKELINLFEGLLLSSKEVFASLSQPIESDNPSEILTNFSAKFELGLPDEQIKAVAEAKRKIESERFYNRTLQESRNALEVINGIKQLVTKVRVINFGIVSRVDWGDFSIEKEQKILHLGTDITHGNQLATKVVFFTSKEVQNGFELSLKAKLLDSAVLNILLITEGAKSEVEDEFYMARLDTRGSAENLGDGILLKPKGTSDGTYSDNRQERTSSKPNKWISSKVIYQDNTITLLKKVGARFEESGSVNLDRPITKIGISNIVEKVEIKDLKIK